MTEPSQTHVHPEAGPWLDDARRILTLIETAGQQYGEQSGRPGTTRSGDLPGGECAWCPLCQALSVARRSAPDLLDRFAELASGLAATIRATQPERPEHAEQPDAMGGPATPAEPAARPAPPETVRIDITD